VIYPKFAKHLERMAQQTSAADQCTIQVAIGGRFGRQRLENVKKKKVDHTPLVIGEEVA
jgi:hypothetical protein